ncbi:MAG: hypothetical protein H7068_12570 [Pedobacter sp.]|nr:hypothetical protein [Chitinophagaceae bacterium]
MNVQDTLFVPNNELVFLTDHQQWSASLLTPTQPIALAIKISGKHCITTNLLYAAGVTEGPAEICLSSGNSFFYYPVYLLNKKIDSVIHKDYRSPKTVNPDSSLHHQRMLHSFDVYRNIMLLPNKNNKFFFEDNIYLPPKTAIFRADKKFALSSFYVQPGSCTIIAVKALYNKQQQIFSVTAGPLKDKYDNAVADGTLVAFVYTNQQATYRMETSVLNGFANVNIPTEAGEQYQLWAKINETVSKVITLIP